jgi:hypothetical protein
MVGHIYNPATREEEVGIHGPWLTWAKMATLFEKITKAKRTRTQVIQNQVPKFKTLAPPKIKWKVTYSRGESLEFESSQVSYFLKKKISILQRKITESRVSTTYQQCVLCNKVLDLEGDRKMWSRVKKKWSL